MKPLEKNLERRLKRWLKLRKLRYVKLKLLENASYPDLLIFIPGGSPLLLELKRDGKEPSRLQAKTMKALDALGYNVAWSDDFEEATAWIQINLENGLLCKSQLRKKT